MEPSNNTSISATHLQHNDTNNAYPDFLNGISNFATSNDQGSGHDDIQDFFHPELFDTQDVTTTGAQQQQQQQPQNFQSAFNAHASRQSQSPALPAYNPGQHTFTQHPKFTQHSFDPRMYQSQQTFDPRFYQNRPSQSPASMDHHTYQNANYHPQNYQQQPLNFQARQSATPTPAYSQNQPAYSPYGSFDSRPSPHTQPPTSHLMQFQFPEQTQTPSQGYVNPTMLNSSQDGFMSGHYPAIAQRPTPSPQYFSQPGSSIDPRFQIYPGLQPAAQNTVQPSVGQMQSGMPVQKQYELVQKKKTPKDPNAPKRPRGRPRKDGSMPIQGGQATESESESDSDISVEEEPEKTPALLSVQMPTDEKGKAMYQAVQAVWSPRNLSAPVEKIKNGIVQFGDTIKAIRDSWKDKNESLKKAELPNSPTAELAVQLKADVAHYRQVVETVINRSLQHAHPAILKRLGENQWTMSALYAFMLDRVTVGDYDSSLVTSILKLAINFETVDEEKLEATKWPKLLQRLSKKATSESKTLAQTVTTNATAATARKKAAAKNNSSANGDMVAGVKRGRDGEAVKKAVVKPSSKPLAVQNAERRRAQEAAEAAKKSGKPAAVNGTGATSTTASQKAKVIVTQPPKVASFASLMSASKRPGTSNAERAAATKDGLKPAAAALQLNKKDSSKRESPPRNVAVDSKPTSSLAGFLSTLEKKEEAKPAKVEEVPNETPEDKEKRLRKESRRKLRVSWKADPELVETRLFTHDPDEEIGHTDNSMKDAGDTMKEGEMLKRHKEMDDLDDDDEDEAEEPVLMIEYTMPTEVDFTVIQDSLQYNGIKHGGSQEPQSPSREAQDVLEQNSVMVVFALRENRPDSPKEPPDEGDDGDFQPCIDFGAVPPDVREKESKVYAQASNPLGVAGQPLGVNSGPANPAGQLPMQQWLGMLNKPQAAPATQPTPGGYDLQKLLASVASVKQQLGAQPQPSYQQSQPTAPPVNNDLSSLLATLQQQAAAAQGNTGLPLGAGSNPNPYPGVTSEKHGLDASDYGQQKSGKKKKGNNKSEAGLPSNYKTMTCQFWLEGKCNKGDNCTYRHDRVVS